MFFKNFLACPCLLTKINSKFRFQHLTYITFIIYYWALVFNLLENTIKVGISFILIKAFMCIGHCVSLWSHYNYTYRWIYSFHTLAIISHSVTSKRATCTNTIPNKQNQLYREFNNISSSKLPHLLSVYNYIISKTQLNWRSGALSKKRKKNSLKFKYEKN